MPELNLRNCLIYIVVMLALLMSGCASQKTISAAACPNLPPPPVAMQPKPQLSYSENAAVIIEMWHQRLMDTLPMQSNAD